MKLQLNFGLPFVTVHLISGGKQIEISHVLVDTGSGRTIFATDQVAKIGLILEPADDIRRVRGVGGSEFVFSKQVDALRLGDIEVNDFEIEVGGMDYGFLIGGIIGMDFLSRIGAIIDLDQLLIYHGKSKNEFDV